MKVGVGGWGGHHVPPVHPEIEPLHPMVSFTAALSVRRPDTQPGSYAKQQLVQVPAIQIWNQSNMQSL